MMKGIYALIMLLMVLLLAACNSKGSSGCPLPPEGFSESDLVGTWSGYVETAWDSTIVIKGDGRYKQIMNIKRTGFQYESDWRPWRITYSEQDLPYLHLEGLLMCAYWQQIDCLTGETGIEPVRPGDTIDIYADATYWYDYCQEEWVDTPGEGVFMVFGAKRLPRGIELVPLTKSADGDTGPSYELREPVQLGGTAEASKTSAAEATAEPKATPDQTHCIVAPLRGEAQNGTPAPPMWNDTAEPEVAQAASDGSCVEMGEEKYVKHAIGTRIDRGGTQGGIYVVWAPKARVMVMVGPGWMAQDPDAGETAYLNRQGDKLYPENSTTPVLQDLGNDSYVALVNFYEVVLP
jgi:hypothetical protein